MDASLGSPGSIAAACARIARALASPGDDAPATLGSVRLLPHQRDAVTHLRRAIARWGGALLADPVGTGKTYVALAIAANYDHVTVLAPATLRDPWARACDATGVRASWHSHEGASRRGPGPGAPPAGRRLVILDEAHHLRNPATRRYHHVAHLVWGADVLLLSATPLHNRASDLTALTALFLGASAATLRAPDLARLTCRQLDALPAGLPTLEPPTWVRIPGNPAALRALQALPPALPPADGGRADALGRLALLRQWASSDAALDAAIARRLATGLALETRLCEGHHPTRAEVRRWIAGPDTLQLGLSLDVAPVAPRGAALATVRAHLEGLRQLRAVTRERGADACRITRLRALLGEEPGRRAVLFTHSADTARATFEALARHCRCALLTGRGPRVAAGRATRDEITRQFDPLRTAPAATAAMRVDVLVATDLLSEGVDLHDAGLLVHLDLPWTVARLEQRAGRLRRLGATHQRLRHLALEPPGGLERVLRLDQRLARKAGLTTRHLGDAVLDFGLARRAGAPRSPPPAAAARLAAVARAWHKAYSAADRLPSPVTAAIACHADATFIAVVTDEGDARVVVGTRDGVQDDPAEVARACEAVARHHATDPPPRAPIDDATCARQRALALGQLTRWCATERSRAGLLGHRTGPAHREVLRVVASARPTHARHAARALAPLLARTRALVLASHGAGAERVLAGWARAFRQEPPRPDDLSALCDLLEPRARPRATDPPHLDVLAVLLLVPPRARSG